MDFVLVGNATLSPLMLNLSQSSRRCWEGGASCALQSRPVSSAKFKTTKLCRGAPRSSSRVHWGASKRRQCVQVGCSPETNGSFSVARGSNEGRNQSSGNASTSESVVTSEIAPEDEDDDVDEETEVTVEKLRDIFLSSQDLLAEAHLRTMDAEAEAQVAAERAIALREEATKAERIEAKALARVEEALIDEKQAEKTLEEAHASFLAAENLCMQAEEELRVALQEEVRKASELTPGAVDSNQESGSSGSEVSSEVSVKKKLLQEARQGLEREESQLKAARTELTRLQNSRQELKLTMLEMSRQATIAREEAEEAEDVVTKQMSRAEEAMSREMEVMEQVEGVKANLKKAVERASGEERERLQNLVADLLDGDDPEAFEEAKSARGVEPEATVADLEVTNGSSAAGVEKILGDKPGGELRPVVEESAKASFAEKLAEAASLGTPKEKVLEDRFVSPSSSVGEASSPSAAAVPQPVTAAAAPAPSKSSTKKSSKFYSAPFFSAEDGEEFSPGKVMPAIAAAVKRIVPKMATGLAILFIGGCIVNARMERKLVLQTPSVVVSEQLTAAGGGQASAAVRPAGKPLLQELKKVPERVKAVINKLPRHEPNEEETQLYDVLWLLLASVVFVPIFSKLPGGSPVLGYLAAGALIGPYALSIIQHVHGTKALAEFGVVFLMFNIGLELSLERLRSMRKYVFGLGSAQVLLTALCIGFFVHLTAGIAGNAAIVIGNGLALSSTAVVLQVLQERGESTSRHGRATFSVLLFQDLAVVVLLILIPLLAPSTSKGGVGFSAIAEALGIAAIKAVVAIAGIIAGGRLLLRPIYKSMAENHNAEIFAANTLLVVLGTSVLTARAGLSMALGAFLAGLLLAETEFALQVESDINPYRGILLGLFFMTVGMSIDPRLLVARFPLILGSIALLIGGKTLLVVLMGRTFGMSTVAAFRAGLLLAPGGEFAFVAFGEAVQKGIMDARLSSLLFLIVGISMAITPWLAAVGQLAASKFEQQDVKSLQPAETETDDLQGHIIICGFGRVGQIIAQLLSERLIPFVALDVRTDRVSAGRALDLPVYFGDAGSRDVLHKVGAERAAAAVITLDTPGANYRAVWALSKNFPNIKTFVRAHDVDHGINLEKAGATAVVPETLEPSLQLAAAVLAQAKLPAAEIASTIDDFRIRHLAELTELSALSGTSLGYGFSRMLTKPLGGKSFGDDDILAPSDDEVESPVLVPNEP